MNPLHLPAPIPPASRARVALKLVPRSEAAGSAGGGGAQRRALRRQQGGGAQSASSPKALASLTHTAQLLLQATAQVGLELLLTAGSPGPNHTCRALVRFRTAQRDMVTDGRLREAFQGWKNEQQTECQRLRDRLQGSGGSSVRGGGGMRHLQFVLCLRSGNPDVCM